MKNYISGKNIGEKCKIFRELFLNISLKTLVEQYEEDISYSSAAAFENGKSSSYRYISMYVEACHEDEELEHSFLMCVFYRNSSIALTVETDGGKDDLVRQRE